MYRLNRHTKSVFRRTMKQKRKPNPVVLKKLAVALAITIIAAFCYIKAQPHTFEAHQQNQLEHKSIQLKSTLHQLEQQRVQDSATQKKLDETNKQLQETQKQLEAKRNTATVYAAELPAVAPIAQAPAPSVTGCGSDPLMAKIYQLESGCRTGAYNELGCRGLGQACPGSKLPCTDSDWNCQDAWFRQYAVDRYGSIYQAYVFRINHNWW
jgi:hypothetical protein